jgi:hypothetical protein
MYGTESPSGKELSGTSQLWCEPRVRSEGNDTTVEEQARMPSTILHCYTIGNPGLAICRTLDRGFGLGLIAVRRRRSIGLLTEPNPEWRASGVDESGAD